MVYNNILQQSLIKNDILRLTNFVSTDPDRHHAYIDYTLKSKNRVSSLMKFRINWLLLALFINCLCVCEYERIRTYIRPYFRRRYRAIRN